MKNDRRTKTELIRDLNTLRKQIRRFEIEIKNKSKAEKRIQEALEWQKALVEGSQDAIVITDINSKIIAANTSFCTMTGYSRKELFNKYIHELYGEKDLNVFLKYYDHVIAGKVILFKAIIRKSDSKEVNTEFNSRRIDINGRPYIHSMIRDITSRKQIERKLTIFDYAMRSISEAITITDEHNTIVFVNDAFLRMYGYEREELIGSPINILRIEETQPTVDEVLDATLMGRWQGELINRRKDGSTFPIWLSTSVVCDESGMLLGLIGITTDITERKWAEKALQKSEERYRTLINDQVEGIAIVDAKEYFTFVNPAGEKIFGVLPGDLEGRNLAEFVDSEQMKSIKNETQKRSHGERSTYEFEIKHLNGERRSLLVTGTPQFDKDGNFIGTFGEFHDITERKQAEQARKEAEAALRTSEEYFREVIENSSDIIIIVDRLGKIKYASPSVERFLGYHPNEMVGKRPFHFIHPVDIPRAIKDYGRAIMTRETSIPNEFRVIHKDGSNRVLEGLGKNLLDHPSIAGFMMNVHDVTENRKAEAALRQSRDQLRSLTARLETVREKERKYIAHEMHEEFGQILSAIKIQMSEFARKYSHDEKFVSEVAELSGFIDAAIHSVRKISTELRPGVLDLLGLTAAIEWQAKEFSKQFQIACSVDMPKEAVRLQERISIILFRIFQEALKNVADHAQASHVHIHLHVDAEHVELVVEDNGKGISEEQLKSPSSIGFVRMKERALSIGGSAEIKATKGKGTSVLIRIPLSR
jgi:PAS domain S-box-containing protein